MPPVLLLSGRAAAYCRLEKQVLQTTTTAQNTLITFGTGSEIADDYNMHSTSVSTERITIPAGLGGLYTVSGGIIWVTNTNGLRAIFVTRNGVTQAYNSINAPSFSQMNVATVMQLAAGDFVTLLGYQSSGGNLNISAGVITHLAVARLR
jgi:hypothetical protein